MPRAVPKRPPKQAPTRPKLLHPACLHGDPSPHSAMLGPASLPRLAADRSNACAPCGQPRSLCRQASRSGPAACAPRGWLLPCWTEHHQSAAAARSRAASARAEHAQSCLQSCCPPWCCPRRCCHGRRHRQHKLCRTYLCPCPCTSPSRSPCRSPCRGPSQASLSSPPRHPSPCPPPVIPTPSCPSKSALWPHRHQHAGRADGTLGAVALRKLRVPAGTQHGPQPHDRAPESPAWWRRRECKSRHLHPGTWHHMTAVPATPLGSQP
mmetsp:Transcript_87846/g.283738  ORF Transcript_87846/g.283738 Transcript_87846/m.283738 type:complete len:266 (-) Transcript_87846:664-1461(-)